MVKTSARILPCLPLLALACAGPPAEVETAAQAAVSSDFTGECGRYAWNRDDDRDGLDDGQEQCVLEQNAPLLVFTDEEYRPVSVEYFLAHSELKVRHQDGFYPGVPAQPRYCHCSVKNHPNQLDLSVYRHYKVGQNGTCAHGSDVFRADDKRADPNNLFYLDIEDGARRGDPNPLSWMVYGHVYKNGSIGGVDAQYWFLYGYSDGIGWANHEGDWEMVTVRRKNDGAIHSVIMCRHGNCQHHGAAGVQWVDGAHPKVWVANGTHASYASSAQCKDEEYLKNAGLFGYRCRGVDDVELFYTWPRGRSGLPGLQGPGISNIGEKNRAIYGSFFQLATHLRWGDIGTGPPTGPLDGDKWIFPTPEPGVPVEGPGSNCSDDDRQACERHQAPFDPQTCECGTGRGR